VPKMDTDDMGRPDLGDGRTSITSQGTATRLLEAQRARKVAQVRPCVVNPTGISSGARSRAYDCGTHDRMAA
jgi:hypothetical protein